MYSFPSLSKSDLQEKGAYYTAVEIGGQPQLWLKTYLYLYNIRDQLASFLNPLLEKKNLHIILTGAGTSAFIGDVLQGIMQKSMGVITRSIATTDIVTHPEHYFLRDQPTLLISFARSGNSPESVKAVELANEVCNDIYHLIITCNSDGQLVKQAQQSNAFVFLLPPEANDQSLAMTGSFTSMLLSGILIARLNEIERLQEQVRLASQYGQVILNEFAEPLQKAAQLDFVRAVFLGSGIFQGVARESHLKLQELTDGHVICKFDTFLGFRHGPKAVITPNTLMVYILSNQPYAHLYEKDLIDSVYAGQKGILGIGISEHPVDDIRTDLSVVMSRNGKSMDEEFLAPVSVLPAQMIGFYKSLHLGLKPDSPSESGAISRVVQGVKLYPYSKQNV